MRARPDPTSNGAAIRLLTLTLLLTGLLMWASAYAADQAPMMQNDGEPGLADQPRHGVAGRMRRMRVDTDLLGQSSVDLELVDQTITIVRERVERNGDRHLTWIGHVEGSEESSEVVLTRVRGKISGHITLDEKLYEVSTTASGSPIVFEVNKEQLPPDVEFIAPFVPDDEQTQRAASPNAAYDGPAIVDLMVLYTPRTCSRYGRDSDGGCASTEAKVLAAVAAANQAYNNSAINVQLNLVHMDEVSYNESGDMGVTLSDLQRKNDGRLETAHTLRDRYGADIVSMITEDSNACGVGYVMQSRSAAFAGYAFNVVYSSCLSSQTLAHEVGHNMGSQHDRDSTSFGGVSSYAYGYRACGSNGFTTVMAYGCSGASGRSHFSNPQVRFSDGRATGTATANNARSINETATTVSAWRASTNGGGNTGSGGETGGGTTPTEEPIPAAPQSLVSTALSSSSIEIRWNDRSDNEDGFNIDRATGTGTWRRVATVGANTTRVVNNGLASNTNFRYRVRAFNGTGASAWSNIASATTARETTNSGAVPSAPVDFRYRYNTRRNRVILRWTDTANNETGFNVIRNNRVIAVLPANSRYYRDYNIQQSQTYTYRVEAFNGAGGASTTSLGINTRVGFSRLTVSARTKRADNGDFRVVLVWSGASGGKVKILRNGKEISTTKNDGRYVNIRNRTGTWKYRVCNLDRSQCSNAVQVTSP